MTFAMICPTDGARLDRGDSDAGCPHCGTRFVRSGGIWRMYEPGESQRLFLEQYRTVRRAEGWGAPQAEYYMNLPQVAANDPQEHIWRVRQVSFNRLLRLLGTAQSILDTGAGNGWLSYQLARRGHAVAALDLNDDDQDGLGATRFYPLGFDCYQADFTRMPFAEGQFDVVLFNASLHYAPSPLETLCRAARLLRIGGRLIIVDSPLYDNAASGAAMVQHKANDFRERFGFEMDRRGAGYLTFHELGRLPWHWSWFESSPDRGWTLRRRLGELRSGREPAHFGVLVSEPSPHLIPG